MRTERTVEPEASAGRTIIIDPLSCCSLLLELFANGQALGTATGFTVQAGASTCLITNWHVLAGRNPDTGQPCHPSAAIPDQVFVTHHDRDVLGRWKRCSYTLYNSEGAPAWIEHQLGNKVDVVALPLGLHGSQVAAFPFDLALAEFDMVLRVAMPVSIIGFPFGLAAGGRWPIWKTGHVATDPDVDYDGRPSFLIDATTRGGMSGSPVVARIFGPYESSTKLAVFSTAPATRFLGVYSGRIHQDADVGRVWRPSVIKDILKRVG